jgi:uncharacterized protein (TIGR00299 family) protein
MMLYLDMFSGISGDMVLGAFIDLGVPKEWLTKKLSSVLKGFELRSEIVFKNHLKGVNLFVDVKDNTISRNYMDIRKLITLSELPESVKKKSLEAFEKIAEAEAGIHGKEINTVHFHEIGGIDSLVDIIGSFLSLEYLGITRVVASKIPLGSGFVDCAHGRIPVPVPATLAILKYLPVTGSDAKTEIVTPTGAAIVATLASKFGPMPEMEIQGIGYGAGKRETGSSLPNLLRMVWGKAATPADQDCNMDKSLKREKVFVIKTHVDDMNPEISGFVMEVLMEKGALDVAFTPISMKKNRPGILIEVICRLKDLDTMSRVILTQTTSIGVRYHVCERIVLEREIVTMDTSFGPMEVKRIVDLENRVRYMPEYEACKKTACKEDLPLRDVYARIMAEVNTRTGPRASYKKMDADYTK